MNITINRAELLGAVQKAAAIASEDAPLEPLKGVLLEADAAAGTLTLTATNIETSLEQKLSCSIGGFEMDQCQKVIELCKTYEHGEAA